MKNERKRVMTILKRLAGVYTPDFELESLHNDDDDICDYVKSGEYGLAGWLCNKKEFLQDVYDLKIQQLT